VVVVVMRAGRGDSLSQAAAVLHRESMIADSRVQLEYVDNSKWDASCPVEHTTLEASRWR
jgi:hypothetical protein